MKNILLSFAILTSSIMNIDALHIRKNRINVYLHGAGVDILSLPVEAVVNAANTNLLGRGGLSGQIFKMAGPELTTYIEAYKTKKGWALDARVKPGTAVITPSFKLKDEFAKTITHIIHTPGPDCRQEEQAKEYQKLLETAYRNSLMLAVQNKLTSIAFPSLSTGIFKCPLEESAKVAMRTILNFINQLPKNNTIEDIHFALFDQTTYQAYLKALNLDKEPTVGSDKE